MAYSIDRRKGKTFTFKNLRRNLLMTKIGIIVGSTRPNRVSIQVAEHVLESANNLKLADTTFELVDLKDYNLPMFDEPAPVGMLDEYSSQAIKDWSAKIGELDGYIFVTPEYNKSLPAVLKNALEHLGGEWANKAAGIVAYGSTLGVSSQLALRQVLNTQLSVATVSPFGAFSIFTDFENMSTFKPAEIHAATTQSVIEATVTWAKALESVRK